MNPQAGAIDEKMDRLAFPRRTKRDYAELLETPGQGRVIRDWETQFEQLGQRPEEALSLAKRKMEDHPNRQSSFDSDISICALTAGFPAWRFPPGGDRVF